jgi:hypothetical protein
MTKPLIAVIAVTLLFNFGGATAVTAHQDGPQGRPNRSRAEGLTPADVEDMLDALALVQAEKNLQVSDTQYPTFVTRLKNLHQTRKRNRHGRIQLLRELQRMTAPQRGPADEALVRERLKALRDHDDRSAAELRKSYDALDEILDARQQARFRVFELELERRKLDLLVRARLGAARSGTR